MSFQDIFLIVLSSAGLLHGVLLAVFFVFLRKKRSLTHILLGAVLFFMALRIGKSIVLNFSTDLEVVYIYLGLSFLLLIGPLVHWYMKAMTIPSYIIHRRQFLEFIPFLLMIGIGVAVRGRDFDLEDNNLVILFGSSLIFIYLHLAVYVFMSYMALRKVKGSKERKNFSKSQKSIMEWLRFLVIGLVLIWIAYFVNIIENSIPYVIGPLIYSAVIYFLSYKAWKLKILDLDGGVFQQNDNHIWFQKIMEAVHGEERFLDPELSLAILGKIIHISPQKTSEIINQSSGQNFNDFINQLRIKKAQEFLIDDSYEHLTISSIAYDVGFNSLSSFNYAFKKFVGLTPSSYRKGRGDRK